MNTTTLNTLRTSLQEGIRFLKTANINLSSFISGLGGEIISEHLSSIGATTKTVANLDMLQPPMINSQRKLIFSERSALREQHVFHHTAQGFGFFLPFSECAC